MSFSDSNRLAFNLCCGRPCSIRSGGNVQKLCLNMSELPCQGEAQDSALSIDVCRMFSMLITSDKAALRANMKLMRASSANSSVEISPTASVGLVFVWSTRSLIKTRKRIGPRCEPWGTPAVILCGAETASPTRTFSERDERYDWNQATA